MCSVKAGYPKMAKLAETSHKYTKSLILIKKCIWDWLITSIYFMFYHNGWFRKKGRYSEEKWNSFFLSSLMSVLTGQGPKTLTS